MVTIVTARLPSASSARADFLATTRSFGRLQYARTLRQGTREPFDAAHARILLQFAKSFSRFTVTLMFLVTISTEDCVGCGECVGTCPSQIIEMVDGKAHVTGDAAECLGCESCVIVCAVDGVKVEEY